jgi:hypothetical protein
MLVCDHYAVNQDARYLHLTRVEAAALNYPLYLGDDDTGVTCSHRYAQHLERQCLSLRGEITICSTAGGREFSHALLAGVARKTDVELNLALDRLTTAGLLFREGAPPHASYLFKHARCRTRPLQCCCPSQGARCMPVSPKRPSGAILPSFDCDAARHLDHMQLPKFLPLPRRRVVVPEHARISNFC